MKYKYLTISFVAVVAVSVTLLAEVRSEKKPDAPDAGQIVSPQAKEFALPDAIEMVKIPAGKFTMGSSCAAVESPFSIPPNAPCIRMRSLFNTKTGSKDTNKI